MQKSKRVSKPSRIIIYNYSMNDKSDVLASNIDWVNSFARHFESVKVISFESGNSNLQQNVKVSLVQSGNFVARIAGALQLLWSCIIEFPNRKKTIVFHHMSSITAGTIGYLFKLMGVPQGLWYSHSHADFFLRISKYAINAYFSTSYQSFPLDRNNLHPIGHGINVKQFDCKDFGIVRSNIVAVGRVAPIKRLEKVILAISESKLEINLDLIGNYDQGERYTQMLERLSTHLGVQINFKGSLSYSELPNVLATYSIIFSGTPLSIDKAALEGAVSGCFVLTDNNELDELTGMNKIYLDLNINPSDSLNKKLSGISQIPFEREQISRELISRKTSENCNVSNVTIRITEILSQFCQ
jgi:glycosyltransferase involved in cell wall biosynthesis